MSPSFTNNICKSKIRCNGLHNTGIGAFAGVFRGEGLLFLCSLKLDFLNVVNFVNTIKAVWLSTHNKNRRMELRRKPFIH